MINNFSFLYKQEGWFGLNSIFIHQMFVPIDIQLNNFYLITVCDDMSLTMGVIMRQLPHQSAPNSTMTGLWYFSTSSSKADSFRWIYSEFWHMLNPSVSHHSLCHMINQIIKICAKNKKAAWSVSQMTYITKTYVK